MAKTCAEEQRLRLDAEARVARLEDEAKKQERARTLIEEANAALATALEGLLRDMHTGTSMTQRGSLGPEGLGCGRLCSTCDAARAALSDGGDAGHDNTGVT